MTESSQYQERKPIPFIDKDTYEELEDDGLVNILKFSNLTPDKTGAKIVTFNDTGNGFAASDSSGNVVVMFLRGNKFAIIAKSIYPTCLSFYDYKNGIVFLGTPSNNITVYDLGGKMICNLHGHKKKIKSIHFDIKTEYIFSFDDDECIIWEFSSQRRYRILKAEESGFSSISYFPMQNTLVTCLKNSSISFWSLDTFQISDQINLKVPHKITNLTHFAEDKSLIAIGSSPWIIQIQLEDPENYIIWRYSNPNIKTIGSKLISGYILIVLTDDNALSFIDLQNNSRILGKKVIKEAKISEFSIDHNGKYILLLSTNGDIYLYDCERIIMSLTEIANKRLSLGIPAEEVFENLEFVPRKEFEYTNLPSMREKIEVIKEEILNIENKQAEKELPSKIYEQSTKLQAQINDLGNKIKTKEETLIGPQFNKNEKKIIKSKPSIVRKDTSSYQERWTKNLELPFNKIAFENLVNQGIHPTFKNVDIPGLTALKLKNMRILLSCLAYYDRTFAEILWLPNLILPFVKLFSDDLLLCFELVLSFLIQWGQHFFSTYPSPPLSIFATCDKILKFNKSPALSLDYKKILQLRYTLTQSLQNLFSDILTQDQWLELIDFLIVHRNHPIYLVYFIAAYIINFTKSIEEYEYEIDVAFFYDRRKTLDMESIFNTILGLKNSTPDVVHSFNFTNELPLPQGRYPLFKFGPRESLEVYSSFRNKILSSTYNPNIKNEEPPLHGISVANNQEKASFFTSLKNEESYIIDKLENERKNREERLNRLKEIEQTIKTFEKEDGKLSSRSNPYLQESTRIETKKITENNTHDVLNFEREIYDLEVSRRKRLENIKAQFAYQKNNFAELKISYSRIPHHERESKRKLEDCFSEEIQRCRHSLEILNNEKILQNQELEESKTKLKNIKQDSLRNTFQTNILNLRRENVLEIINLEKEFETLLLEIEEKLKYEFRSSQKPVSERFHNYSGQKDYQNEESYVQSESGDLTDEQYNVRDDSLESSKSGDSYMKFEKEERTHNTGNFGSSMSPYKISTKFGQSISSYQYSETVPDENERNQVSRSENRNSEKKLKNDKSLSAYSIDSSYNKYK